MMIQDEQLYNSTLEVHPLTPERWLDLEELFGPNGGCGGCWCMYWRLKRSEFDKQKGGGNKRALKHIVDSGETPGILAYDNEVPIAWCSIAPRECFSVLGRSRILKPVDNKPVWSVSCFFVEKSYRRRGITAKLLKGAVSYAKDKGARIIEGYPIQPRKETFPVIFAWTGFYSAFKKAGFVEVFRRSETRPIMRYVIKDK